MINPNIATMFSRWEQIWSLRSKYESALPFSFRRPSSGPTAIIHPQGITRQEDAHIRKVWARMSGWSTYMSAFHEIRRGNEYVG
tara:strand:+ start:536 stop:787 length:252 start_codon:yes stop_codon:yes gene_type:complete